MVWSGHEVCPSPGTDHTPKRFALPLSLLPTCFVLPTPTSTDAFFSSLLSFFLDFQQPCQNVVRTHREKVRRRRKKGIGK